jgi:GT2 family glycosyltransferase
MTPPMDQALNQLQFTPEDLARWIVQNLQPTSVLHVGCQDGRLVAHLRKLGVLAWGIDSEERSRAGFIEGAGAFCRVAPAVEPYGQQFDLIVCLELVPGLPIADAEALVQNMCQHSQAVLFSATPFYRHGLIAESVQSPAFWSCTFSRIGFYHDLELDEQPGLPWAMLYRRASMSVLDIVRGYEDHLWKLRHENRARRALEIDLYRESTRRERLSRLWANDEVAEILNSHSWRLIRRVHRLRWRFIPIGSQRERWMYMLLNGLLTVNRKGLWPILMHNWERIQWQFKTRFIYRRRFPKHLIGQPIQINPVDDPPPVSPHQEPVDIIVCVHNALEDVKNCLESILAKTPPPYRLILVDDGSGVETRDFLAAFAAKEGCQLIRNEQARGYTRAANQGLRASTGQFVILINSDTIVTNGWVDRMITCANSDPKFGIIGPLSNTASWQSIPEIDSNGDWAANPLPDDLTVDQMGELVARYSGRIYPEMKFLNGFCLMIRRQLIDDIGYFDEETFGQGYGEEDDYSLRARKAGWKLALADDSYIYHAQSKSYSHEKRKRLTELAGQNLIRKHSEKMIREGVTDCRENRTLQGIRAQSRQFDARRRCIQDGQRMFADRRVLFVLPIQSAGGGGNVVFSEARAMRLMGVDVQVFNLVSNRDVFLNSYPNLDIPVIFGEKEDLVDLAAQFDALVATANNSVAWLIPVREQNPLVTLGYYVQGFEPLMYSPGSEEYQQAFRSYTLIPEMVLFTKTNWTSQQVFQNTGARCALVGPSVEVDLFRPRPRQLMNENHASPVRIGAMVRANSPYRAPKLTMSVLRDIYWRYGSRVEILVFGMDKDDPDVNWLPTEFSWKLAGVLSPRQVANYINELDIFADFSSHQAMGLTALEAMACGVAVIVPSNGGATEFAVNGENALVIDTTSEQKCLNSVARLVEDQPLREKIQRNALSSASQYFPERPALEILKALFHSGGST